MRTTNSRLLRLVVLTAAACLLAAGSTGCGRSYAEDVCSGLTAIASDAQKMQYAKQWLASHLADKRFVESLRKRHTFEHGDERWQQFGAFDWSYLGLSADLASLEFDLALGDSGGWDVDRIGSALLRYGRSFILIRLNPARGTGIEWPPEELTNLKPMGEDVYVYCESTAPPFPGD